MSLKVQNGSAINGGVNPSFSTNVGGRCDLATMDCEALTDRACDSVHVHCF